ncbi:MAG: ketoacyl-ACP synthase III [Myxococcota bacterium]
MRHAAIASTGICVPSIEVTNDELKKRFATIAPTFVDKIAPKSGIGTRWYAPSDWATSDLAAEAGREALSRLGMDARDLDLVIVGTDSPDYITPSTSVVVQRKLGATRAGTFDVGCACASFPTALATASALIATQRTLDNVLVIGAYMMRKLADPNDPMVFLYGDGAGAAVLVPSDVPGVLSSAFRADGHLAEDWCIAAGGTREPITPDAIAAGRHQVRMTQKYPPAVNEEGWPWLVRRLAKQEGFALADVDAFIFTQVRRRTIEKVMTSLEISMEKAHLIMDKWGYTGSACVPMALHDAIETGRVGAGDLVVMVGSGVGYNQAATALRLTDALATRSAA